MRWIALALSYTGLLALSLAMPKHYRQVFAQTPAHTRMRLFRLGGWLSLSGSLAASVATDGWSFGPVEWVGMVAFTGCTLVLMLPYAPRVAAFMGLVGLLLSSITMFLW
jgi:uncharacterized protein DUF3325